MRKALIFTMILFVAVSCSYKEYIYVQNQNNIPDGTRTIILMTDIETTKNAFKKQGIMLSSMDGGFKTEEILLDEGTRAMYKAHEFDGQIKLTAFWGITQKVKSDLVVFAGANAASAYDVNAWDRVIYDSGAKRSKKVFDYVLQIILKSKLQYRLR